MKKLLVIIAFNCCIGSAMAQTSKGDRLVGGSGFVGVNSDNFLFELRPDIGWFVKDKLAVGLSATLFVSDYFDYSTTTYLSADPFVRYYFTKEGRSRFYGFGSVGVGRQTDNYQEQNNFQFLMNASIGVGYAFFITDQVALEANTGYSAKYLGAEYGDPERRFFISLGFQIHLLKK